MRRQAVLILCWLVMLGNCLVFINIPTIAVAVHRYSLLWLDSYLQLIFVLSIMSFCCAFILRRMIVRAQA